MRSDERPQPVTTSEQPVNSVQEQLSQQTDFGFEILLRDAAGSFVGLKAIMQLSLSVL